MLAGLQLDACLDVVEALGLSVSKCVPAWSGYDGDTDPSGTPYDSQTYKETAAIRARWRCTLTKPLQGETEWCFAWAGGEGHDAVNLGYPADLTEQAIGRSC
jgi:hypothetical protein